MAFSYRLLTRYRVTGLNNLPWLRQMSPQGNSSGGRGFLRLTPQGYWAEFIFNRYRLSVLMVPLLGLSFYLATMGFRRSSDLEFWYGCY